MFLKILLPLSRTWAQLPACFKYKIYFPTTAIKVTTFVFKALFSSSSSAIRVCKGKVGSGALVVRSGGGWVRIPFLFGN
jgi:hypothetical protein